MGGMPGMGGTQQRQRSSHAHLSAHHPHTHTSALTTLHLFSLISPPRVPPLSETAGMPGMGGGMPGGIDPSMMAGLMNDPEIMAAMSNPKVMAAMQQCMGNPMAMMQYMDDPEVR